MARTYYLSQQSAKEKEREKHIEWEFIIIVCIEREPHCAKMAFIIRILFSTSLFHCRSRLRLSAQQCNEKVIETQREKIREINTQWKHINYII